MNICNFRGFYHFVNCGFTFHHSKCNVFLKQKKLFLAHSRIYTLIVKENRSGSWPTVTMHLLKYAGFIDLMLYLSMQTTPSVALYILWNNPMIEDLPEPEGPTSAIDSPPRTCNWSVTERKRSELYLQVQFCQNRNNRSGWIPEGHVLQA